MKEYMIKTEEEAKRRETQMKTWSKHGKRDDMCDTAALSEVNLFE